MRRHVRRREDDYGHQWVVLSLLRDAPKNEEELRENFHQFARRLGLFPELTRGGGSRRVDPEWLCPALQRLEREGYVVLRNGCYELTEPGREQADKAAAEGLRAREVLDNMILQPVTVSKVTMVVHFALAALKLPAALLSGSVGLLNDAVDTLLDGVGSLLVWQGIKADRERLANIVLVALMLGTGSFAAYEAVRRLFVPSPLTVDWLAVAATCVSGGVCALLWLYQRFTGLKRRCFPLITQSVDSRNHVLVALGVLAGLVAAAVDFPLLDVVIGLVVAALILKSAIELAVELARREADEGDSLSRYRPAMARWYDRFRVKRTRDFLLMVLDEDGPMSTDALHEVMQRKLGFSNEQAWSGMVPVQQDAARNTVDEAIGALVSQGWARLVDGRLGLTQAGRDRTSRTQLLFPRWGR